jgi:hypothetical protein
MKRIWPIVGVLLFALGARAEEDATQDDPPAHEEAVREVPSENAAPADEAPIKESIIVEMVDKPAPKKKKHKVQAAAPKKSKRKAISAPSTEKAAPAAAPKAPALPAVPLTPIAPRNP